MKCANVRTLCIGFGLVLGTALAAVIPRLPLAAGTRSADESLDVRYARAYLRLAQAQLNVAEAANQRVPGTFSTAQVAAYREGIKVSEDLVKEALEGERFDRLRALVQLARYRVDDAERSRQLADAANRQLPGTVGAGRMDVLQAHESLARLDYESGRSALTASPNQQLQWRLGVLEDEVLRLREEVSRFRRSR